MNAAKKIAKLLETGRWFVKISPQSLPAVLKVLSYWSNPLPKTTKEMLKRNQDFHGPCREIAAAQGIKPRRSFECHMDYETYMMSHLMDLGNPNRSVLDRPYQPEFHPTKCLLPYYDGDAEAHIYDHPKTLLPPQTLLEQYHPALNRIVQSWPQTTAAMWTNAGSEVERSWVPNPVLFVSYFISVWALSISTGILRTAPHRNILTTHLCLDTKANRATQWCFNPLTYLFCLLNASVVH